MKKTDELVRMFSADIKNKDILEVACGAAGFSVSAARIAHHVDCIDLDDTHGKKYVYTMNRRTDTARLKMN